MFIIILFLPSFQQIQFYSMSVIQKIRDKYARFSVIAIAVALMGFILTDYISGRGRNLFRGGSAENIGSVNGRKIEFTDFEKKVKQQEDYTQQQGYAQPGEAGRQQAIEEVWNQEVSRILMDDEINKMGIRVSKKELGDILYGANAPDDLKKQFTDPQTGQFNPVLAKQQVDLMLKKGTAEQKESFNTYISQLEHNRMVDKYNALFSNSSNAPRWLLEKQNADNSQLAKISLVRINYTDSGFVDSTIKISDKEIAEFISKHKEDYKQEESRSIAYVFFSAAPSAADSADAKNKALAIKEEFDSTQNVLQLLTSEGANTNYYPGYIRDSTIQIAVKDSIFKMPVGRVYGPYLDGGNYMLAKLEGKKQIPDTVKIRHILIATAQRDPQSGQMTPTRDTAEAKKIIDSIQTAIHNGSNFDTVCARLSEDPGRKDKGGVYDKVSSGQMVAEFNDFIFLNPVGAKGIVKTVFGYHYTEILSQKGSSAAYKIAYLPKQIVTSTETDNNASNAANGFAGDSRNQKSFDANYEKTLKAKGINKNYAAEIKPADFTVQGLGISRNFVRNIYNAKRGEVLQPERIGDEYVVAVVTEINEKGTQSVAKARNSIEPLLRNRKKAELIKQKLGNISTLEAAAAVYGKKIETIDSLRMMTKSQSLPMGYEPKLSGAAFNPANKGKLLPEALEGMNGVYVLRVDNLSATALANANVAEQRKMMYQQAKQMALYNPTANSPVTALKNAANIKDNRANRY